MPDALVDAPDAAEPETAEDGAAPDPIAALEDEAKKLHAAYLDAWWDGPSSSRLHKRDQLRRADRALAQARLELTRLRLADSAPRLQDTLSPPDEPGVR
jgi:hypothetical protein